MTPRPIDLYVKLTGKEGHKMADMTFDAIKIGLAFPRK